jgi:hypothetical protein
MRRYLVDKRLRSGFGQLLSWYIQEIITREELLFLMKTRFRSVIADWSKKEFSFR